MTSDNSEAGIVDNQAEQVLSPFEPASSERSEQSGSRKSGDADRKWLAPVLLILILGIAAVFRFTGINWDDTYHLHPDERFLTDVASLLQSTDPITYLKTSESPLNPYNVNKTFYVYGNFPMTVTRLFAEAVDKVCLNFPDLCSGRFVFFDGIHLVGRTLSAFVDLLTVLFTFLIGLRLYDWRAGIIAAILMAAAVLPIQQSHYFTMDNWAATLTVVAIFAAVRASENARNKLWWAAFGVGLGLTVASRINLAPLAAMAVVAAAVWLGRRASEAGSNDNKWRYLLTNQGKLDIQLALIGILIAAFISAITFRLAQPYAFADGQIVRDAALMETGKLPGFVKSIIGPVIGLNPQWQANMAEIRGLQSPDASFPPALQWTDRIPIIFPLTNLVLWGMGLTAGLAGIGAFLWALWRIIRGKADWVAHALPVAWAGLYFLFMSTRWVKSIRYFLPIYPFLALLAGWALIELWRKAGKSLFRRILVAGLIALVIIPTLLWANSFIDIYRQPVTRVQASKWMFENIPSGATLLYEVAGENKEVQLPLRSFEFYAQGPPLTLNLIVPEDGQARAIRFNYLSDPDADLAGDAGESLHLTLTDASNNHLLAEATQSFNLGTERVSGIFPLDGIPLTAGNQYLLIAESGPGGPISAGTSILANEHWDDSLPVRLDGRDPYSMYYSGLVEGLIPITYPDSEEKRQSFFRWLDEADYIVLSSQRALWSIPRLPMTFPLTIRYYDALFNNELGFELVGQWYADFDIGPLHISDITGKVGLGTTVVPGWPPPGDLAVEEAFSVYDHPPVWLFAKSDTYDADKVSQILGAVDLNQVQAMTPGQATRSPNGLLLNESEQAIQQANGSFSQIFDVDGALSTNPWLAAIVWWLVVVGLGWLTFPISFVVFSGLPEKGYAITRILSLLLISYFTWLMASLKILPNSRGTILLGVMLVGSASLVLTIFRRQEIGGYIRRNLAYIGFAEVLAVFLYLVFIVIRLGNPDVWDVIWGGEKPMDLSYFNAVMKSTFFPPYDPWFAGGYINYYYYGFVLVGTLTKLLAIVPTVAYNLILPMLASFTGLGTFSIAYNVVAYREAKNNRPAMGTSPDRPRPLLQILKSWPIIAGLISVCLVVILGNLAEITVVFTTWFKAGNQVIDTGIASLDSIARTIDGAIGLTFGDRLAPIYPGDWFWSATRVINIQPGEVAPITEFPFFTFLYGDLHAHMIALPLTILALAWAISLILQAGHSASGSERTWPALKLGIQLLAGGLIIGVLRATNTWDFPTYLLLGLLAVGYSVYLERKRIDLQLVGQALFETTILAALAVLLFLPFSKNYGGAYESVSLWPGSYTRLMNYLLIYGIFLFLIISYLASEFRSWTASWTMTGLQKWQPFAGLVFAGLLAFVGTSAFLLFNEFWIAPLVLTLALSAGLLAIHPRVTRERKIVLILIAASLSLTLMVEFIVLDGDIGRMNTVFKFYLQAWVMLSIASGVIVAWVWPVLSKQSRLRGLWRAAFVILLAVAALYPLLATKAKWDIRMSDEAPITLDGMAFMPVTTYSDSAFDGSSKTISLAYDYEAIRWMQQHVKGSPVIAEAHGSNPYRSIANRVAMYTGLPTVIGWDWHQRQQRAVMPPTIVSDRIYDVNTLYNTTDSAEALAILDRYGISYIYVGPLEWSYYFPEGLLKFDKMAEQGLLREVYRNEGVRIFEVVS